MGILASGRRRKAAGCDCWLIVKDCCDDGWDWGWDWDAEGIVAEDGRFPWRLGGCATEVEVEVEESRREWMECEGG